MHEDAAQIREHDAQHALAELRLRPAEQQDQGDADEQQVIGEVQQVHQLAERGGMHVRQPGLIQVHPEHGAIEREQRLVVPQGVHESRVQVQLHPERSGPGEGIGVVHEVQGPPARRRRPAEQHR